ncbi:MAG: lysophospholipid acyltransferase family protein [Solimonas sp.]
MYRLIARLGYAAIWLLLRSYRFRRPAESPLALAGGPYILAIWHQNLFAGILAQTGTPHVVMVSRSRHANPLSYSLHRLGHCVVRGSSRRGARDKGGSEAREDMILELASGTPGAITVDGPKGPAREVKRGIVDMALRTGLPIVPYAVIADRYWSFPTWDRLRLPKPFAAIHVHYGEPIWVSAETSQAQVDGLLARLGGRITALDRTDQEPDDDTDLRQPSLRRSQRVAQPRHT